MSTESYWLCVVKWLVTINIYDHLKINEKFKIQKMNSNWLIGTCLKKVSRGAVAPWPIRTAGMHDFTVWNNNKQVTAFDKYFALGTLYITVKSKHNVKSVSHMIWLYDIWYLNKKVRFSTLGQSLLLVRPILGPVRPDGPTSSRKEFTKPFPVPHIFLLLLWFAFSSSSRRE